MKKIDLSRREKQFLALTAAFLLLFVLLAFCFAVPFTGAPETSALPQPLLQSARVELNTAGVDALCTLPGVGEARARAIIAYRVEYGPFHRVEDVAQVPGITPEIIASWQGLAYIS